MATPFDRRARFTAVAAVLALGGLLASLGTASATNQSRAYFHGSREQHAIALTFDDGWTPSNCAKVDRILQAQGAAATFFPSARWVRRAPSLWKELATRYPFGDHTDTHPHMKGLSYAQQYDEITRGRQIIEGITGVPLIPVFRAPYGEFDSTTLAAAAAAGFPVTMEWDVNVYDLTHKSDAELLDQATAGHNGSVITMHCGADATVRILPKVIDFYRAHGFGFVTIPELLSGHMPTSASPPASASPTPEPTTGAAAALGVPRSGAVRTPTRLNTDLLRSIHLLAVLALAGAAVMLWGQRLRHGAGGAQGPARAFRGSPRA